MLDKSVDIEVLESITKALNVKNTIVKDNHIWKIATTHQAAILSVSSISPLSIEEYKKLLLDSLPSLSHISVEINSRLIRKGTLE